VCTCVCVCVGMCVSVCVCVCKERERKSVRGIESSFSRLNMLVKLLSKDKKCIFRGME